MLVSILMSFLYRLLGCTVAACISTLDVLVPCCLEVASTPSLPHPAFRSQCKVACAATTPHEIDHEGQFESYW